ncbi:MAG: cytochrome c biogenesis protein ResB [Micrococcales bacterium]|nr:cytochrome c biogenesis protein ResB [Micrococcales bacterium]
MSQDTATTRPAAAAPEPKAPRPVRRPPSMPRNAAHKVYALFYNKHFGLFLILAMAVLTLLGTLLQQAPDEVRADATAYQSWLDDVRPRYRGWTTPLSAIGAFHVFSSVWFKAVCVLLALSIVACTTHRLPQLWARAQHPHTHVSDRFFDHAGLSRDREVDIPAAQAFEQATASLRHHRYRTIVDPRGPGLNLYADRFRWGPFGTVLAHTGFVVVILGALVSANTGFKLANLPVTVGTQSAIGHDTGLSVEATNFTDSYYEDGQPKDYASDLVLYKDGARVAGKTIRVNQPLRYDGVTFYQASFGTSAVATIADATGKVLFKGGIPLEWSTQDEANVFGKTLLKAQGLEVYAVGVASGGSDPEIAPGQMRFEVYRADSTEPVDTRVLDQGKPTVVGDLTLTFERERPYTGLRVANDHGTAWVYLGCGLMMVGLIMTFGLRHRRIWVRVTPTDTGSRVRVASPERHDITFQSWFGRFTDELAPAMGERPTKTGV